MSPRTPPSQWAALFNFAGGGIVHNELFALILMTTLNPSLFEAIASYLFPYGTHSARPAAGDVPIQSFYFETDTTNLFQNQAGTWVQVASIGGGGAGVDIQVNGVSISDQTVLNFLDTASVTWSNPANGDVEATAPSASGALSLVQTITLGSDNQNITFSGLDGDTDAYYLCEFSLILATGSSNNSVDFRPNSQASDLLQVGLLSTGGTVLADSGSTWLALFNCSANDALIGTTRLHAKRGATKRTHEFTSYRIKSGGDAYIAENGIWTNDTNNLTSYQIHSDTSAGLKTGSTASLYKLAT